MTDYFQHLTHFPPLPGSYLKVAQSRTYLNPGEHNEFTKLTISATSPFFKLTQSKFFKDLVEKFPTTMSPVFFKIKPMELYDWHVDFGDITSGINILLSEPSNSFTLFKVPAEFKNRYKLVRCDYAQFVPTVFDTTVPHCVMNLSNEDRYLLKIPVRTVPYSELTQYLLDYECRSYDQ
jgi:hypothetical protein